MIANKNQTDLLTESSGYILIPSLIDNEKILSLKKEFKDLQVKQGENKIRKYENQAKILNRLSDANQIREEVIDPPILIETIKQLNVQEFVTSKTLKTLTPNGHCSYYNYINKAFIEKHLDHRNTDFMLLICLERIYGKNNSDSGILKLFIPKRIDYFSKNLRETETCQSIVAIDLKEGQSILIAGGYIPHEVTPLEIEGSRLIASIGYKLNLHNL